MTLRDKIIEKITDCFLPEKAQDTIYVRIKITNFYGFKNFEYDWKINAMKTTSTTELISLLLELRRKK